MRRKSPRQLTFYDADLARVHAQGTGGAEACVLHLAERFRREYEALGKPDRVPEELDWAARACVYVCARYPMPHTFALLGALDACRDCLETFEPYRYLDELPFDLCRWLAVQAASRRAERPCRQFEGPPDDRYGRWPTPWIPFDVRDLAHGASSVRYYLFQLGWLVRAYLAPEDCVPCLLLNVENTLGHWFCSLALCYHLFTEEDAFWTAAESYAPEEMPGQYQERITWSREHSDHLRYPPCFLDLERKCARIVQDCLFGLRTRLP